MDGSIWIAGYTQGAGGEVGTGFGGPFDAWFVHADNTGNLLSAKVLGSSGQDEGFMVYPLSNGNVIAGGYYENGNGSFDTSWGGVDAFIVEFGSWPEHVINLSKINNRVKIYPNPTNEQVTITTEQQNNCDLIITDVVGKIIYKTRLNDLIQIQVSGWPPGIYYVQAISESGYKEVQKLVIQ